MNKENPPRDDLVEKFEDTRELPSHETEQQFANDIIEQAFERPKKVLTPEEEDKIAKVRYDLSAAAEINQIASKRPLGDEKWEFSNEEKQQPAKKVAGLKKAFLSIGFLLAGLAGQAKDGENNRDSTGNRHKTEKGVDLNKARKVNQIPGGYETFKKDNKTYGIKVTQEKGSLEMAKSGPSTKDEKGYQDWLINQLQNGTSPEELVEKKYISEDKADDYKKYYKASTDVVYMEAGQENNVEPDPFARFAKKGEPIYAPGAGGHIAAEIFYPVRATNEVKDAGVIDTKYTDVLIRYRDDFGFTGESLIIPASEMGKIFGGTNHFQSHEKMMELKALASANKNKLLDLSAENLVEIQGSEVASK